MSEMELRELLAEWITACQAERDEALKTCGRMARAVVEAQARAVQAEARLCELEDRLVARASAAPSAPVHVHDLGGEQETAIMTINAFRGRWTKLGNYSPCLVFYNGHAYQSVEHAYQAQKSLDPAVQEIIRHAQSPAVAKRLARQVKLRPDWETIKIQVMRDLLFEKFVQEPERTILLATGDANLIEGNWWGDRFWGQCPVGEGENWLGRLLMELRAQLGALRDETK
jgi:ribA/ribD-fused uncharacterized protein